jgi:hypothetical protein
LNGTERDERGRYLKGVSGNPAGRPRGSKNRPVLSPSQWVTKHWKRAYSEALITHGNAEAALFELAALYAQHHPLTTPPGLCPACHRPLKLTSTSLYDCAVIAAPAVLTHARCEPIFTQGRLVEAASALRKILELAG